MFPSSQTDMHKFCCNRSTCPKRREQMKSSYLQTSSLEEIDETANTSWNKLNQETQISSSLTTTVSSSEKNSIPDKTSEKSSQNYFNRNNQNLSFCYNKFCPSNSSQTSQSKSQKCAVMIKCPSIVAKKIPDTHMPQCYIKSETIKNKCICQKLDITPSSSTSALSEHFPVKLNSKCSSLDRKMPVAKRRHQSSIEKPILAAPSVSKNIKLQSHICKPCKSHPTKCEQYYSCSSDDTDDDNSSRVKNYKKISEKLYRFPKRSKADKNNIILELLHEIVHLINNDNPIRNEALRITQAEQSSLDEKSSNIATQTSEVKMEDKDRDLRSSSIYQYPPLIWPPPCLCYTYGMASVQDKHFNLPLIKPYNLTTLNSDGLQIPKPFVYEESDSFKDCSSGNQSLLIGDKMPNNLLCLCSDTSYICPIHGSLKEKLKQASFPCSCARKVKTVEDGNDSNPNNVKDMEILPTSTERTLSDYYIQKNIGDKIKLEDDIDEELEPCYVDQNSLTCYDANILSPDSLLEYDDEEPKQAMDSIHIDEEIQPIYTEAITLDEYNEPCQDCLMEYDDEEPSWKSEDVKPSKEIDDRSSELDFNPNEYNEPCQDCLKEYDDEEPSRPDVPEIIPETLDVEDQVETLDVPLVEIKEETERSPYIVETLPSTGRNVYNFLPDIDIPPSDDPKQIIRYRESEEEYDSNYNEDESEFVDDEYELAKEIRAEKRKKKKISEMDDAPNERMALATIQHPEEGEGSREEMKFFIDSLILDLDAMEYARRKSQFEKNICKSKSGLCKRESFPVTIIEVTDLGANSLYVKWIIHDCYGIGGYEIYTDGYLTNRYYNSKHEAAVITHVDITLPHKIALVAQPSTDDESIAYICNKNKNQTKSLLWKTDENKESKSCSALWTPSIFLYDPITCRAIMRDNY